MLHGTGAINGNTIFVWTARRLQHPPALVNEYEVSCEYEDRKGIIHTFEGKLTLTVTSVFLSSLVACKSNNCGHPLNCHLMVDRSFAKTDPDHIHEGVILCTTDGCPCAGTFKTTKSEPFKLDVTFLKGQQE